MLNIPFLEETIKKLLSKSCHDDSINRLCSIFTTCLLIFFAILVSAKQYIGKPIQCWVPQEFESGWEEYAEDVCFIKNTYYIPSNKSIPRHHLERSKAEIGYYQWVPIILSLMALMFYFPKWIQKFLISQSGIDMDTIALEAVSLNSLRNEERQKSMIKLKSYIKECLGLLNCNTFFSIGCCRFTNNRQTYITTIHLTVKFFHLINIILQFLFLNNFFGTKYTLWGFEVIENVVLGREWKNSPIFPRVTLCDFKVRRLANVHRYTIQCVLMINMFNEKIFLFIWFWLLIVSIVTLINFLCAIWNFAIPINRERTLNTFLKNDSVKSGDPIYFKRLVSKFSSEYIKTDGCLILSFIDDQVGGILVREIAHELFKDYLQIQKKI